MRCNLAPAFHTRAKTELLSLQLVPANKKRELANKSERFADLFVLHPLWSTNKWSLNYLRGIKSNEKWMKRFFNLNFSEHSNVQKDPVCKI